MQKVTSCIAKYHLLQCKMSSFIIIKHAHFRKNETILRKKQTITKV